MASPRRQTPVCMWFSSMSCTLLMRCGPGTSISAGTIRQKPGVSVQPRRIARPPIAAPISPAAKGCAKRMTDRLASSCRAISPTAEDTPLTTIAPQSARSSQAMADAASPKRTATTQRPCRGARRSNVSRLFVASSSPMRSRHSSSMTCRAPALTATLMRSSGARAWIPRPSAMRERDLAIPHDRLHVDTDVPCDPLDAALETLRTDVVFEQEARAQLKEAQRRLAGCRGVLRRLERVRFGGHRSWFQ